MSDGDSIIHTETVSWNFRVTDPLILDQSPQTRTTFVGEIHEGGVRGYVCRQKVGDDGTWQNINEVNFRHIPPDAGVRIEISTQATTRLMQRLIRLQALTTLDLPPSGARDYVVTSREDVVLFAGDERAQAIRSLLSTPLSDDDWELLVQIAPAIASNLSEAHLINQRRGDIADMKSGLADNAEDESFWQSFFKARPWMLEAAFSAAVVLLGDDVYIGGKRSGSGRNGIGGVATDFLFADESTKSFAVVEIKTPATKLIGGYYRGAPGEANEVFAPHRELSGAVVQVRNQISTAVANFNEVIRATYSDGVERVHPKGVLVVGTKDGLQDRQLASFNHFRHGLHSLTVITFDELHRRLRIMYELN
jgi:hypothetical protein